MLKAHWTGSGYSEPLTNADQITLGLGTGKRWYRYTNMPHNRLTLHYGGVQYRPHDGLIHDYGSIPCMLQGWPILRRWFSKDSFPKSVVVHDAGYDKLVAGREHTLWISRDKGETWNLEPVQREVIDLLLYVGILAEDGPGWVAKTYYRAVQVFGRFCW